MRQEKKSKKVFTVLSCVIYTIIRNYVCNHFLAFKKKKTELGLGSGGGYKHEEWSYDKILVILIPDLLMNLMSCHGFLDNKDSVVVLKHLKRCLNIISQKYSLDLILFTRPNCI